MTFSQDTHPKPNAVFKKTDTLYPNFFQKFRHSVKDLQIHKELCVPQEIEKKEHRTNFRKKSINILELEMLDFKKSPNKAKIIKNYFK